MDFSKYDPEEHKIQSKYGDFILDMKWYKVLTYLLLWIEIIVNIINGIRLFVTGAYADSDEWMTIYFFYATESLIMAVLLFVARYRMAKLKKRAPLFLIVLWSIEYTAYLPFFIFLCTNLYSALIFIPFVVGCAVIIALNTKYYKKRKSLFVN